MQATAAPAFHPEPTPGQRRQALMEQFRRATPAISLERTLAFTRSHRQTEGQPTIVRRAKAFRHVCKSISTPIFDYELVVGTREVQNEIIRRTVHEAM